MKPLLPAAILLLSQPLIIAQAEAGHTIRPPAQDLFSAEDDDRPELFLPAEGDSDPSNFEPEEGDSDPENFAPEEGDSDPENFAIPGLD